MIKVGNWIHLCDLLHTRNDNRRKTRNIQGQHKPFLLIRKVIKIVKDVDQLGNKIKVGIVGYGNLGRGAEIAVSKNPDMELVAIFTRRDPAQIETVHEHIAVHSQSDIGKFKDSIDVMILCGGSANDLPEMSPEIAQMYNIVDSFDNHAKIPEHVNRVDEQAQANGTIGIVSTGWDPGLFSMNRLLGEIVVPQGKTTTFWGEGLSQGHSEAVRRVDGVKDAVQYTVPIEEQLQRARTNQGAHPDAAKRHKRVCYVVAEEGEDQERIRHDIETMPDYFADYDTTVHFISEEDLQKNHDKMKHGGFVIRSGQTTDDHAQTVEFSLTLESNPEFTASVLVAYARAAYTLNQQGQTGARTVFDVPLSALTHKSSAQIMKELL